MKLHLFKAYDTAHPSLWSQALEMKFSVLQQWCLWKILCIPYTAHITNMEIYPRMMHLTVSEMIQTTMVLLFGHLVHCEGDQHHPTVHKQRFQALWEVGRDLLDVLATYKPQRWKLTWARWSLGYTQPGDELKTDTSGWLHVEEMAMLQTEAHLRWWGGTHKNKSIVVIQSTGWYSREFIS